MIINPKCIVLVSGKCIKIGIEWNRIVLDQTGKAETICLVVLSYPM